MASGIDNAWMETGTAQKRAAQICAPAGFPGKIARFKYGEIPLPLLRRQMQ